MPVLALAVLVGPWAATGLRAQTSQGETQGDKEKIASSGAADARPLARYVPKENLVLYAEFAGLDAHAEAWKKTAAYKMLNQTPLGVMLEEVAAQLLDKGMSYLPNRRLSGTEVVTLVKNTAKNGWVFALECQSARARTRRSSPWCSEEPAAKSIES